MNLYEFESHLNQLYDVENFKDYCPKGLVVEGSSELKSGITAVSFGLDLLDIAISKQVDFILVHHLHGFWDNQSKIVRGSYKKKIQGLLDNDISLFGYHLPMDSQPTLGNNIGVIQALNAVQVGGFLKENNKYIGAIAEFQESLTLETFMKKISNEIGVPNFNFLFGPDTIKKIGVCTGAAPSAVEELVALGDIDAYITGEARENTKQYCQEEGIHFIAAGHHQTECFGPRLIANYISTDLNIPTEFINLHNPV